MILSRRLRIFIPPLPNYIDTMGEKKGNSNSKRENLLKAVSERKTEIVHLSHNDLDAAGCDAVHRMKYGTIFTIWSSVGSFPSFLRDIGALPGKRPHSEYF